MGLVYVAILVVVCFAIGMLLAQLQVKKARRRGIYPAKRKATIEDVKRLALSGEVVLAMCAYREIYGVGIKEAKEAVNRIVSSGGTPEQ